MLKRFVYLFISLIPSTAFSWECPKHGRESELSYSWNNSEFVYVATVIKASYVQNKEPPFRYIFKVEEAFKPIEADEVDVTGDRSVQLTIGEKYVVFSDGNALDFCNTVLPFNRQWVGREDLPGRSAYVKKILKLAGEDGDP